MDVTLFTLVLLLERMGEIQMHSYLVVWMGFARVSQSVSLYLFIAVSLIIQLTQLYS